MVHFKKNCLAGVRPSDPKLTESSSGPHRKSPGRASWVIILALAAISVAGVVFYAFIANHRLSSPPAAEAAGGSAQPVVTPPGASPPASAQGQGRTISVAPDKAEIRTPLVILRVGEGGDARPVVALGRPEVSPEMKDRQGTRQGILERELIRQAILIAARDELGLVDARRAARRRPAR